MKISVYETLSDMANDKPTLVVNQAQLVELAVGGWVIDTLEISVAQFVLPASVYLYYEEDGDDNS